MVSVPVNHPMMQKMVINRAIEAMGLPDTRRLATLLDGIARRSPEGLDFKDRAKAVGWKQAVEDGDRGLYDWTEDRPIDPPRQPSNSE